MCSLCDPSLVSINSLPDLESEMNQAENGSYCIILLFKHKYIEGIIKDLIYNVSLCTYSNEECINNLRTVYIQLNM